MEERTAPTKEVNLESQVRTDSVDFNRGTRQKQLVHEVVSSGENLSTIREAYLNGRAKDIADADKAPVSKTGEKMPYIVLGSGPSLNKSIEYLRDWKGGIFATTSHMLSLIRYGVIPTHLVALDPFCTWEEVEGIDWKKAGTKLITHPGVWPSLVQNWPNDLILYLENIGQPEPFYDTIQKQMYSIREERGKGIRDPIFRYMIRTNFAMFACSPPLQLFVGDKLGYGTAFLCGCDFAFTDDIDRFTNWIIKKEVVEEIREGKRPPIDPMGYYTYAKEDWESLWEEVPHPYTEVPPERVPMLTNNGIKSERVHVYYKKNFISAWRLSGKTIYTTDHGAITEIPFTDIRKLIRKQGYKYPIQNDWFIQEKSDDYLASVGCYVIEANGGKSFVESIDPMKEIKNFILQLKSQYSCDVCYNTIINKEEKELVDTECHICHKGKLKHSVNVDMEKNMKRIEALYLKYKKE